MHLYIFIYINSGIALVSNRIFYYYYLDAISGEFEHLPVPRYLNVNNPLLKNMLMLGNVNFISFHQVTGNSGHMMAS